MVWTCRQGRAARYFAFFLLFRILPILSPGGHAASQVALLLVSFQHLPDLLPEGRVDLPQPLGILMDGGFGDAEVPCGPADRGPCFDDVFRQVPGPLSDVGFHRLPSPGVFFPYGYAGECGDMSLDRPPPGRYNEENPKRSVSMIYFNSDYTEGCHPRVLEALTKTNLEQTPGYGEDRYCAAAADTIRRLCGDESLAVHFLVGGTQANLTVIDAALRPHQGAVCAESGHIHVHETGAVEATGHKVLALPSTDGKITARQVSRLVLSHRQDSAFEHMAQPKLVYISHPTELGTLYTKAELTALSQVCRELGLYLFLDGARLGYGLEARGSDLTLADIASLTDVFYIGGTKVGALFGEAVVIRNPSLKEDFRYLIKQHGGMLAKGRLLGVQFQALMEEGLYFSMAAQADRLADKLRKTLSDCGIPLLIESTTNQVFPIMSDTMLDILREDFSFSEQCRVDDAHRAVRFCTSWATREDQADALCRRIQELSGHC